MIYVHIFILIVFLIFIYFKNSFFQNLKKQTKLREKNEQVLSSSLTLFGLALIVGVLSGYVTYKTSDSMQVNLEDLPLEEVDYIKTRRIVFVSTFVVTILAFGAAYYSLVSSIYVPPPSPSLVGQDYYFYVANDFKALMAEKLQLSPKFIAENLSAAAKVQDSKDGLIPYFDVFFKNVKIEGVDLTKAPPVARAYVVRLLVAVNKDPTIIPDTIVPQAELWAEYLAGGAPMPTQKLAYVHYLFARVFGYV